MFAIVDEFLIVILDLIRISISGHQKQSSTHHRVGFGAHVISNSLEVGAIVL